MRWECDGKTDVRATGREALHWIGLFQDMDHLQTIANTVKKFNVSPCIFQINN